MGSCLSVSKYMIATREMEVGQALINPRGKGQPVLVQGKYIDEYFSNNQIGYNETQKQFVNGVKFFIHCQKEENFITKIISCNSVLNQVDHETL